MKKLFVFLLCLTLLVPVFAVRAEISVTDDAGNEIVLKEPAKKIISLYSAHTETLYYLGAGDQLIGAHATSVYPPAAAFLPRFEYTGDPEEVIAAEPDLVLIRPFIQKKAPDFVEAIRKAGIPVASFFADTLEGFDAYVNALAKLTGHEREAEERLKAFHERLDAIAEQTQGIEPKVRAYFESTENELRTVTRDSMAGQAIVTAGGINVAEDAEAVSKGSSIAAFGAERILEKADEIDVYISQRGAMNAGGNEHAISIRPGFDTVKAVKDGRILLINEKLVSSPSFRYPIGVMELARFFYPEIMDKPDRNIAAPCLKRDFAALLMHMRHLPVYVPASSKYYTQEHKGHVYGLFEDVDWQDKDFNAIETAVSAGLIGYEGETFLPDARVTREMVARAVFILGSFKARETQQPIADLSECSAPRIAQTLTDNGVFGLIDGRFMPQKEMTVGEVMDALEKIQ